MDADLTSISSLNVSPADGGNTSYDYYEETAAFLGDLTAHLDLYFVPIVVVIGLLGNTCSFLVFVATSLRSLSSSVYLSALAISDNGFLICVFISWANNVDVHLYHRNVWCQTFVYLTYVFSFLSVWYVVGFTVERYIAVCFPFKRCDMCTTRRAQMVVMGMAAFASVAYTFALWTSHVQQPPSTYDASPFCETRRKFSSLVAVLSNIDTVTTFVLPSLALIFLNVRIGYAVGLVGIHQRKPTSEGLPLFRGCARSATPPWRKPVHCQRHVGVRNTPHVRVTKMLLVVSSVFLMLNMPFHACRVYFILMRHANNTYRPTKQFFHWQRFFLYVYYVNFAINFLLYSICGQNFRRALKALLLSCRRKARCRAQEFSHRGRNLVALTTRTRGSTVSEFHEEVTFELKPQKSHM